MAEQEKPGFEIRGQFYPMPDAFRLCDPVLVSEITGMKFYEFAEALDDEDLRADPVILAGLVAVAVWQHHRTWSRAKVAKFMQSVELDELETIAGDDEPVEGEERPPEDSSNTSSSTSISPAVPLEQPEHLVEGLG